MLTLFIIYFFFLHFLADFAFLRKGTFQSKSKSRWHVLQHALVVFATYTIGLVWFDASLAVVSGMVFFLSHFLIDYFLGKAYRASWYWGNPQLWTHDPKNFPYWKDYWFYWNIGLEQFLHASIIIGVSQVWAFFSLLP